MKKIFHLTFILVMFLFSANATIRTLNNSTPSPGQFTTFAAAQTASSAGDTILVSGSSTSYGGISITKSLTLIGTGHNPDKQNPLVSTFLSIVLGNPSTASTIKVLGVKVDSDITFSGGTAIGSNIFIGRSIFNSIKTGGTIVAGSTLTIEGNIIRGLPTNAINMNSCSSFMVIFNNVIYIQNGFPLVNLNSANINNNIFIGITNAPSFSSTVTSCTIWNNIFSGPAPAGQATNCSTSYNCSNGIPFTWDDDGVNINANPLFINYPGGPFSYSHDFRLQAGSPCLVNYAGEGQRGIYGGFPSLAFNQNGEPPIPVIRLMNVTPTTVPAGVPVNVTISSTRKN